MHYYQRHIGDYAKDTGHLTLLEHGVYNVLLDWSYAAERELPDDKTSVYRICRATTPSEKKAVDFVLLEFFQGDGALKFNKRAMKEIEEYNQTRFEKRCGIVARHNPNWTRDQVEDYCRNTTPEGCNYKSSGITRARVPITNNQEPSEGGAAQVSDAEILKFGADWPGEMASGIPKMDASWLIGKIAQLNGRREWPANWKRWLISCWRGDHLTFSKGESGMAQKKNAGPVSASVEEISRQKKMAALSDEEDALAYDINSLRQSNIEVPNEKLERLYAVRLEIKKLKV